MRREVNDGGPTVKVFLNGEDVSNRCRAFDSDEGWVLLIKRDEDGRPMRDGNEIACEKLHGEVTWEVRRDAPVPHVCSATRTCCCSQTALEPDERCPVHGNPLRIFCVVCGKFMGKSGWAK